MNTIEYIFCCQYSGTELKKPKQRLLFKGAIGKEKFTHISVSQHQHVSSQLANCIRNDFLFLHRFLENVLKNKNKVVK